MAALDGRHRWSSATLQTCVHARGGVPLKKKVTIGSALVLIAIAAVISVFPPLRARAKAVAVLADAVGLPFPRPFAADVEVRAIEVGGVVGDLYSSDGDAPMILFVPGATERGRNDARVIKAATALARAGRSVFVPELHLYDRTFRKEDIKAIESTIRALAENAAGNAGIGVVGFSYGASFALIAGQSPQVSEHVEFIAAFGAYFDLRNVVRAITTGATLLDGERVAFDTVPEARRLMIDSLLKIAPDSYDEQLRAAIESRDPTGLPPDARPAFELIINEDPTRVDALVTNLPTPYEEFMTRFSPSEGIDQIDVPVYLMQSRRDEATPWTESVYLERNIAEARLVFLEHFSHVDAPGLVDLLLDAPDAWRFVSWILVNQE